MLKLDYFNAGYFKAKYFRGKVLEDTLTLDAYFVTEVNWVSYSKKSDSQNLHISELAVNNKVSDNLGLFVSTFSIVSEEEVSACLVLDGIDVDSIISLECVSTPDVEVIRNDDEEILISLIMADLI